jgi:hypothetical protein
MCDIPIFYEYHTNLYFNVDHQLLDDKMSLHLNDYVGPDESMTEDQLLILEFIWLLNSNSITYTISKFLSIVFRDQHSKNLKP